MSAKAKGIICSEFFAACAKADGILVHEDSSLSFVVGGKRTGKMRVTDEDEEKSIGDEPLVLEFLWTLEDRDQYGFWMTRQQVRQAQYRGQGVWSVEGHSEPDLMDPLVERFEVRLVRFEPLSS